MADARIIQVIDAMVSRIAAAWTSREGDDGVSREYLAPLNLASLAGRKVWLFPVHYTDGVASRGENLTDYTIAAIIAERYTGSEPEPPKEWIDERVAFVEQVVYGGCDFGDSVAALVPGTGREVYTQTMDAPVYDVEQLSKKQIFWAELELGLQEVN